jgi:hypothetical protein
MITRDNYELVYEELLRELADVDLSKVSADLGGRGSPGDKIPWPVVPNK